MLFFQFPQLPVRQLYLSYLPKHLLPTKNQAGNLLFYLLSSHGFLCCLIHSDLFSRIPAAAPADIQERIKIQAGSFAQSASFHKAWVMQPLTPQLGTRLVLALPPPECLFSQPLGVYLLTSRNVCWLSLKINAPRDEQSSSTTDFQVLVTVGLFVHRYQNCWWMAAHTQIGEGIPTNTDSYALNANEKRTKPIFHVVSLPATPPPSYIPASPNLGKMRLPQGMIRKNGGEVREKHFASAAGASLLLCFIHTVQVDRSLHLGQSCLRTPQQSFQPQLVATATRIPTPTSW